MRGVSTTDQGLGFTVLQQELRRALRNLLRLPGLSTAVILTLALTIGANAAVFSLVYSVLLSPLPYPDPERIVGFWMLSPAFANNSRIRQSTATYLHFQKESRTFESIALAEPQTVTFDDGGRPERLHAALVTASLYKVLASSTSLGRPLVREDSLPGAEPVVMLGYDLWASRFGRDPRVVGRMLKIDGGSRKVVGVLPPGLSFPEGNTQLWLPLSFDPATPEPLSFHYAGYGRLATGTNSAAASRDLDRLINTLPDAYPGGFSRAVIEEAKITSQVRPLKEDLVGDVRLALWGLVGAALALLGIAAVNLANLFAVRAESRRGELAVRSALGARRWQLLVSLLAEGAWLAAAGTIAGLLVGVWALRVLKLLAPGDIPRLEQVELNAGVVAFTAGVSLLVGLLAGLASTLEVGWRTLSSHLRAGAPGVGEGPKRLRLRDALLVVQVALAFVLVVSSGLLVRSYWSLSRVDAGFDPRNVLTLQVALPESNYQEWSQVVGFFHRFVDQIRELPGVQGAAVASDLPLRDEQVVIPYEVEEDPRAADQVRPTALTKLVSEDYFATLGIPVLGGRALERSDAEEGRSTVVINQAFAHQHWPGKSPLGHRIRLGSREAAWLDVVGLVGDVRDQKLAEPPVPILYLPLAGPEREYSFARREMSLAIKTDRTGPLPRALRQVLARMDRGLPIYDVRTLDQVVAAASARTRFTALLLGLAALGALIVGAVGLYGLVSFTVGRRHREIAIRMALGAHRSQVRSMVVGKALILSSVGLILGWAGAVSLGRLLASQLYQVSATDPLILIAAGALLLAVAWLAGDIPARRASRLDPAGILRKDE